VLDSSRESKVRRHSRRGLDSLGTRCPQPDHQYDGGHRVNDDRRAQESLARIVRSACSRTRSRPRTRSGTRQRVLHYISTARSRQGDTKASIIDLLAQHPGSTAGDLANGLNLNPEASQPVTRLAKAGKIKKASRGYSTK